MINITKDTLETDVIYIIKNKCRRYFKSKMIVDELVIKYTASTRKLIIHPFRFGKIDKNASLKKNTQARVNRILSKLRKEGKIDKYNYKTWIKTEEINR